MGAFRPRTLVCDVHALAPDAAALDALARLQLAAGRVGLEVRLRHASTELCCLIDFVGLGEVLHLEPGGEPEEREDRLRAEEERELGDPPV
jgi:hypothetical protein